MALATHTDEELVRRAADGDTGALAELLDQHLHPAWRVGLAASADEAAAQAAVVTGVCDALLAAARHPESTQTLRSRIVGAVHRAAAAAPRATVPVRAGNSEPVLVAFAALPVASRTALWLTEVEGGTPEQVAPVLGLDRSATAALVDRASANLRDRLAADAAKSATETECARALGKLPAQAAGKLTDLERLEVGNHLGRCGDCASWLAGVVALKPSLRRLVVPVPEGLPLAIAERWADAHRPQHPSWLRGMSERAVGAAAAAVLALGLAGAAFLGNDGSSTPASQVANPAAGDSARGSTRTVPLPSSVVPASTPSFSNGSSFGSGGGSGGGIGSRPRSTTPTTDGSTPTTTPPTTAAPPTTEAPPSTTTPPTTAPPSSDSPPENPAVEDGGSSDPGVSAGVPGVVTVEVGECTGADVAGTPAGCAPQAAEEEPTLEVNVPGLPPVTVPALPAAPEVPALPGLPALPAVPGL